jgi:maltose-binding protein MalE
MSWLKWVLIALASVVVLVIVILAAMGLLTSDGGKEIRHISVGQRTITVSHYKDMTQETIPDGVKIVADGHVITVTPDATTIDGAAQNFDPTQDVEISIDEAGKVEAKGIAPGAAPPDDGPDIEPDSGDDASPPE